MVLVTGGSGFVGSHVVRRLIDLQMPVRVLVYNRRRAEKEGRLKGLPVELVQGDILRAATLKAAMEGIAAIIHTAAIAVEAGDRTYETINYEGTVHVVDTARAAGIKRFINLSQLGADPDLPYRFLASKGKAQAYVAKSGLEWTAFRPSVIWGPEDEFANTFARLAPLSPFIFPIIGSGKAAFQPIWVEDVVTCIIKALAEPSTVGKEYELGGPEVLTIEQIEQRTLQAIKAERKLVRVPLPVIRGLVALMEIFLVSPPVTRGLLELLAVNNLTEVNAIKKFVPNPRPFNPAFISEYMRKFRLRNTIRQYLGN
jgi:NADH dehydrogenase